VSNSGTYIVNLGRDPEDMQLGGRDVIKLRVAEKAGSKRAETRWFNAIVGGPDVDTAKQLKSGDQVALSGELVYTSWTPKQGKNKGKKEYGDEMPFAKLLKVLRSPTFFGSEEAPAAEGEPTADAPAGDTPPDLSDLE
jgi:single-stranded DNA-binding protein